MEINSTVKEQINHLPQLPGVYKYFNDENVLIYIGKAKNLKKRVSSYFTDNAGHSFKTISLAKKIANIEFVVVNNEYEALLLENNLIKQNKPKYNILLKDDKTYPYICITNERFPKVFTTRKVEKRIGTYFGPYTSGKTVRLLMDLFQKLFTIRTCNLGLSKQAIESGKYKTCLEYHIGNCKGPCENLQTEESYMAEIQQIKNILAGQISPVKDDLSNLMKNYVEELAFEKAHLIKQKLELLDNYYSKSIIINPNLGKLKSFVHHEIDGKNYIYYFCINNGAIIESQIYTISNSLDETEAEMISTAILMHVQPEQKEEIISNISIRNDFFETYIPKIGDKKKLIDLSIKNIQEYHLAHTPSFEKKENIGLLEIKNTLSLKEIPNHIECFDNSNIQGTNPVSAMVCFKNGKPSKKDYRHYLVKTVEGPNDFDTMYEVVFRRYKRLKEEEAPLPQLIIIDGGKGQLSRACDALKDLDMYGKIPIISIAKRLEEIYVPGDEFAIHFNKKSEGLKIIQQLRDEAHRFGITHHRNLRSKKVLKIDSQLDNIKGIGEKTKELIQKEYKTIALMLQKPEQEIIDKIGKAKLEIIKKSLLN